MIPKGERWQVMIDIVADEQGEVKVGLQGAKILPVIGDINPIPLEMAPPEIMRAIHVALGMVFHGQCNQKPVPKVQMARGSVARN